MKNFVSVAFFILILFAATACSERGYEPAAYIPPTPDESDIGSAEHVHFEEKFIENPPLEMNVRYVDTGFRFTTWDYKLLEYPIVIRSTNELTEHIDRHADLLSVVFSPDDGRLQSHLNFIYTTDYTDEFFAENLLVILKFIEGSCSTRHRVDAVLENGDIHVSILHKGFTQAIGGWSIFIEICNSRAPENFTLHVDRNSWFWLW